MSDSEFVSQKSFDPAMDAAAEALFNRQRGNQEAAQEEAASEEAPLEQEAAAEEAEGEQAVEGIEEVVEEAVSAAEEGVEESYVDVVVDGKTLEVPLSELVAGYHRERDYTAKTTQLAEEKRKVESYAQNVMSEQTEAVQRMNAVAQQLQAELANHQEDPRELEALRIQNPGEYAARMQDQQRRAHLLSMAHQEQARLADQARQEQIPRAIAELQSREPAFAKDFDSTYEQVGRWITSPQGGGLSVEQWNQVVDPRQVLIAYKAMKADEQGLTVREATPRIRKKLSTMPKVRAGVPVDTGQREQSAFNESLKAMNTDSSLDAIANAMRRKAELRKTR